MNNVEAVRKAVAQIVYTGAAMGTAVLWVLAYWYSWAGILNAALAWGVVVSLMIGFQLLLLNAFWSEEEETPPPPAQPQRDVPVHTREQTRQISVYDRWGGGVDRRSRSR